MPGPSSGVLMNSIPADSTASVSLAIVEPLVEGSIFDALRDVLKAARNLAGQSQMQLREGYRSL